MLQETTPLLSVNSNHLYCCLLARVNRANNTSTDSKIYEYARNLLKIGILGISIVGNSSFIPLNYTLSINEYLANVCAASNLTIMTVLMLWSGNSILDEILTYQSPEEVIVTTKQLKSWQKKAINTTLFALGLISQLPYVYSAIKYNSGSFVIPLAASVGIGGAIFPMRSLQLSVEELLHQKAADKIDPTLFQKQQNCVNLILSKRDEFIRMPTTDKTTFIKDLEDIRAEVDGEAKIKKYISKISSQPIDINSKDSSTSMSNTIMLSIILTFFYEVGFGLSTWRQTQEEIVPNDLLAGILALLSVASTSHIMLKSMVESTEHLLHYENDKAKNITMQLYDRKILVASKIAATATNLLALLVTYVMFEDLFQNKWEQGFMEIVMCFSTFLLYQKSTFDTLEAALVDFKGLFGNADQKKSIIMINEFENFANFLQSINPNYVNELLSKFTIKEA